MNTQNRSNGTVDLRKSKKNPIHPALASALLTTLILIIYVFTHNGSTAALALSPVLPVLAIFATGTFAYTVQMKPFYAAIPVATCTAAALVLFFSLDTGSVGTMVVAAVPSLVTLVTGATLGYCTKKRMGLTQIVIAGVAVPLTLLALAVLSHSYVVSGSFTETLRVAVREMRQETLALVNESLAQMSEGGPIDLERLNVEGLVSETFNILPGTLVAVAVVAVFLSHKAMCFTAGLFGSPSDIPEKSRKVEISAAAAVIYTVSLALSLFLSDMVGTAAHNLAICLVPGLALVGASGHFAQIRSGVVRIGCLPIIMFVFLLYINPALALKALALLGAFHIVSKIFRKSKG